jgi:23S rRNA (uridine2552-2'-O)-methyltransferase
MGHRRKGPDHYSLRAKKEGMVARSVYKLEEIDRRWKLFKRGYRVLDLGCAPGSWLQYIATRVGAKGLVLGYDLKPCTVTLPAHAQALVGDVNSLNPDELGGLFDVVCSDMAPATMGQPATDALRSAVLAQCALDVARQHLLAGGSTVVKVLEGGEVPDLVAGMKRCYTKVERLRPKATRKQSTEIFLVGLGIERGS